MEIHVENWKTIQRKSENQYAWKHKSHPLWMWVSYTTDHGVGEDAVYKWHARAVYSSEEFVENSQEDEIGNITFNQYEYVLCDDGKTKEEAKDEIRLWVEEWMKSYYTGKYNLF